jgi:MoxR-like ATPase
MEDFNIQEVQAQVTEASAFILPLKNELARIISGQEKLIERLIIGLITNGHLLVEGVPGLAKTLTISSLAKTVSASCSRIQFTPDLLPADIVGTSIYNPREHEFSVKKGPVFANLVLADEINRAPAKVQSALLEAMQERQVTIGGETYKLPDPFLVMATQNPLEQEGTYPLPEAQMDRFMMMVQITYPKRSEEAQVLERMAHPDLNLVCNQVTTLEQLANARKVLDRVYLDPKVADYILDIVIATRPGHTNQLSDRQKDARLSDLESLISSGGSPRATLSMALAARAHAFIRGRAHVIPQDVKEVAPDVLRHRIIPTYEAEAENLTSSDLVERILNELRTP